MADRSPCLVLGKSCRGGCGDGDGDEMERAFTTHVTPRMAAAAVAISGRSGGGGERILRRVDFYLCVPQCGVLSVLRFAAVGAIAAPTTRPTRLLNINAHSSAAAKAHQSW